MTGRKQGIVTRYDPVRGFGFLACVGEADYYFHVSQVQGRVTLAAGQEVSFEDGGSRDGRKKEAWKITPNSTETGHHGNSNTNL